jgi:hypothetical protein
MSCWQSMVHGLPRRVAYVKACLKRMDPVAPIVLPSVGRIGLPYVAHVPSLKYLRALGAANLAQITAWRRQRSKHLGADAREVVLVFGAVKLMRAVRAILAITCDEVGLLGWLVLWRVPVVDAPEDAHPAEVALKSTYSISLLTISSV